MGNPTIRNPNFRHPHRQFFNNFLFPGEFQFNDVPGLGFDFPHLAAVSGANPQNVFVNDGAFPFGFGGFLLSSPPMIVEQEQPADNQAEAEEGNATDEPAATVSRQRESQYRPSPYVSPYIPGPSAAPVSAPVPQRDVQEYVFVRRDGGLVFAVAYSWENGTLRYVTHEGVRRSIPRDALDLDATQQFNEQRGLNFRLPV